MAGVENPDAAEAFVRPSPPPTNRSNAQMARSDSTSRTLSFGQVAPAKEGGLGTFGGVFTPSILTILGVIMYLRFGWVVGNVGLLGTLLVVTISTTITFLTALSIAAIATDQRVRAGGAYYMISRSLGLEWGGAIGIPLFLAQGLSVALYTVGFAESVATAFPMLSQKWVGVGTTIFVAGLALASAKAAIRAQYVIMGGIVLSLVSFWLGSAVEPTHVEMWGAAERHSEPFWTVFAVFFPAVTGIMAGVNMSGDLRSPRTSIPKGTFWAIGVGYAIYMSLPVMLALRADALTLIEDPLIMRRMSLWGDAILIGVWGATLSSAVGSILGAPRVLQALARDGVLPKRMSWLGKGSGQEDAPRLGTLFTLVLALVAVWFGDLNMIAPILTMFFLTTYGVLNVAAGMERLLQSPSFRPEFKVHWAFSLLGAIGCFAVMVLINALATVTALIFVAVIYIWLERRELKSAWGDIRTGLWMALTRTGLFHLRGAAEAKSWRPHLLVLSGAPQRRWHLVQIASAITHGRGLITVSTVLPAGVSPERQARMESVIGEYLGQRGVQSLVRVITAPNPFTGSERLVDAYGLGQLVPNTIILGDSDNEASRQEYCDMIAHFHESLRNVIIVRENAERTFGNRSLIDVWWGGLRGNGGLMIILAFLIGTDLSWRSSKVRLNVVVPSDAAAKEVERNVRRILDRARVGFELCVLVANGRPFKDILHAHSAQADLVIMGLADPSNDYATYLTNLRERTKDLPTTLFVLGSENVAFEDVLL